MEIYIFFIYERRKSYYGAAPIISKKIPFFPLGRTEKREKREETGGRKRYSRANWRRHARQPKEITGESRRDKRLSLLLPERKKNENEAFPFYTLKVTKPSRSSRPAPSVRQSLTTFSSTKRNSSGASYCERLEAIELQYFASGLSLV